MPCRQWSGFIGNVHKKSREWASTSEKFKKKIAFVSVGEYYHCSTLTVVQVQKVYPHFTQFYIVCLCFIFAVTLLWINRFSILLLLLRLAMGTPRSWFLFSKQKNVTEMIWICKVPCSDAELNCLIMPFVVYTWIDPLLRGNLS